MDSINIIAEIGSVHDGSLNNAKKLIELASGSGADTVKFQTHIADAETLKSAPNPSYFKGESRYEYFERTGFINSEWLEIKEECDRNKISFLSSAFSHEAIDLLENLNTKLYKIPSGEVTNIPLIKYIAETNKEIYLSSGMSNWSELDTAVNTILNHHDKVTIMQCSSQYPCNYENVGINIINDMKVRYNLPLGFSDHTTTNYASFAAATLGVSVIEKHLTFSKKMYGSDAQYATEPEEFKDLVNGIRAIETMNKCPVDKDDIEMYKDMKMVFQKSIVSKIKIKKGQIINYEMLAFKKPGIGIPPNNIDKIIGKVAKINIDEDLIIKPENLE